MTRLPLCTTLFIATLTSQAWALEVGEARHLLGRTNFAAKPAEVAALLPLDRAAAVRSILDAASKTPSLAPPEWTREFIAPQRLRGMSQEEQRAYLRARRERMTELQSWWFEEMIASPAPITEVMTLFWHNHFTSSLRKVRSESLMYRQNELLRSHALGNFGDLLRDIGRDPAMVIYLDNFANRKDAPNENYARELLELFTLGEGHYSEQDIKEIARAFTGWTVRRPSGEFAAVRRQHDNGIKTIFGRSGRFDGDDVVDILLQQPRIAEFIVEKLWRAFISDTPDAAEVVRLARIFRDAKYEMKPVLTALLTSDAFWAPENRGTLIKSPVELLVGTVRQFDLTIPDARVLVQFSRRIGQDLFAPPNVKGWPGGEAWITADTYLQRQAMLRLITQADGAELAMRARGEPEMDARQADGRRGADQPRRRRQTAQLEASPANGNRGADQPRRRRQTAERDNDRPDGPNQAQDRRQRVMARMVARMSATIDVWHTRLPEDWRNAETIVALILPAPPADIQVLDDAGGGALVRALINDPVYQLK